MSRSIASLLVPSFIKRRYAMKFVVSIAFVLLAIGLVGAAGYAEVNATIEDDTRQDLESQATLQADAMAEWTQRMSAQTRTVAQIDDLSEGENLGSRLDRAQSGAAGSGTAGIYLIDFESEEVVATSEGSEIEGGTPLSAVEDPWATPALRQRLGGQNTWVSASSYESQASAVRRVVAFVVAVEGNSDRAVVLEGSADVRVNRLYQGGVNQSTSIVSGDYEYVLQPEGQERTTVEDAQQRDRIDDALAEDGRSVQFSRHGERLRVYAPIDGVDQSHQWVAVTSVPVADAYAVRDTVGLNVALIIASGILTLGLVALVLGRQTVTPLKRLRSKARAMEQGDLDVDMRSGRIDEIGQLYSAFDSMRDSLREQIRDAESARDEAQAERERVRKINETLEHTAAQYSAVMEQAAEGDLTARMPTDVENQAMAAVALDFNEMLEELEQTVGELNAFAAEVATASEEVTAASEEVRSASEQISESVQEISAGAERQTGALQTVNQEMADLSTTTEQIAVSSNEVADIAERTAATGQTGREAAQAAIEEMHAVEGASEQAVEEISRLETEVGQVDELIERIQEIADQTNMLALNANIEASRSAGGEGDGGFGVVAQEVKELSEDAKATAAEVEQRLESIREQTRRSADEVEQTSADVDAASRQVSEAVDALEEIADYASETHGGVQEISAATEQQAASTEEVVSTVDEATTISEETTAESENVAAAAEEQTTALVEVSRSASDLSEQAARLSEALDRFETDAKLESGPDIRMLEEAGASTDEPPEPEPAPPADEDVAAFQPDVDVDEFGADRATESAEDESDGTDDDPEEDGTDGQPPTVADDERPTDGGTAVRGDAGGSTSGGSSSGERDGDSSREQDPADASESGADGGEHDVDHGSVTDRTGADVFGNATQPDGVDLPATGESPGDEADDDTDGDAADRTDDEDAAGAVEPSPEAEAAIQDALDDLADDVAAGGRSDDVSAAGRGDATDADVADDGATTADAPEPGHRTAPEDVEEATADDIADAILGGDDDPLPGAGTGVEEPDWEDVPSVEDDAEDDRAGDSVGGEGDGGEADGGDGDGGAEQPDDAAADRPGEADALDGQAGGTDDDAEVEAEAGLSGEPETLTDVHGVGESKAESLREAGFETVEDLREADLAELADVSGFGQAMAEQVKEDVEE